MKPSSPNLDWLDIRAMCSINCSLRNWAPPAPPPSVKPVDEGNFVSYSDIWLIRKRVSVGTQELSLYPAIEQILLEAVGSHERNLGQESNYSVVHPFGVVRTMTRGPDFSVDYCLAIMSVDVSLLQPEFFLYMNNHVHRFSS